MAKQVGPHFFIGTIGDLIFYKLGDQYYVRKKSSYNKKKMQKPGAYPLMHLKQDEFGQASKLASRVRRQLPLAKRKEVTIGSLTKEARKLLRQAKTHEEIIALLLSLFTQEKVATKLNEQAPVATATSEKKPASLAKTEVKQNLQQKEFPVGAILINGQVYLPLQDYQLLALSTFATTPLSSKDRKISDG